MTSKSRIFLAEIIGTMILVVGGPGTAIFWNGDNPFDAKVLAVSLAFGLSLMCAAYCIGAISGCHINPAVTIGLLVAGKTKAQDAATYIAGQIVGGLLGAGVIAAILSGLDGALDRARSTGFASNGYGDLSPGGYGLGSVAIAEIVATALFVLVVVSTSRKSMAAGHTPIAVGFMLTLVHMVTIPISNTSVNPARSLATAVFADNPAGSHLGQVWAFILFPIIGGAIAGALWKTLCPAEDY